MTSRFKQARAGRKSGKFAGGANDAGHRFATRHRAWLDAVARLEATIQRLKDAPAPMGNKWRDKQVDYFESMLVDLRQAEPQRK